MNRLPIYIGYDKREEQAVRVAVTTAGSYGCPVTLLAEDRLRASGMLTRTTDRRNGIWDFNSSAPQSTEFAITRFFVPLLAHSGWCLFVDCDVVFLEDPNELMHVADPRYAVQVVKHDIVDHDQFKMDGQVQTNYHRKLWSSVMLINTDHKANRRINLSMLNSWPGRDLHAFNWLNDEEIGNLPPEANWLVNLQSKPERPIIAHYTKGGPWCDGWQEQPHDDLWLAYASEP